MGFDTFLTIMATVIGILGTLFMGAVWVLTLTSKISNRAFALERDMREAQKTITDLENKTSFTSLEVVFTRVCFQVFHSEEFREASKAAIRDTLLHIERNRTAASAGAFDILLSEIRDMHADILNNQKKTI